MYVTCLIWLGGQDCIRFCRCVLLSLCVTICATTVEVVSWEKEVQAPQPLLTRGCQGTLEKPIPWGQTGKEVKPVGAWGSGKDEEK